MDSISFLTEYKDKYSKDRCFDNTITDSLNSKWYYSEIIHVMRAKKVTTHEKENIHSRR